MVDLTLFLEKVRAQFGPLKQSQVNGFTYILETWETSGLSDLRFLAYMLATAWHETAKTMQPIAEYGKGKGRPYGIPSPNGKIHYGRGYVQLTWGDNYKKMGKLLGVDLYNDPDLAMRPDIAAKIMFEGMTTGKSFKGDFTGKHLGNYFNKTTDDPKNARRIINGLDKADLIAGYHNKFLAALT